MGKPFERAGRKAWGLKRNHLRHASPAAIYSDPNITDKGERNYG